MIKQFINKLWLSNPIYRLYVMPVVIGFGIFACMGGLHILPPSSIDWIMSAFFDPQTSYLGWEFFRHTPLWQFPIGANPALGLDISSSIVFTDSIPLLAVLFKPFSPLLGDVFQYLGFWLMLCYVLQYFFAYKLISYFNPDTFIQIIGAFFFVLAPAFLIRTGIHMALSGHWLVLAAFCIFFADRFLSRRWLVLLSFAISINVYLLLMVAAIWCCDIIQKVMQQKVKLGHALINLGQGIIIVSLLMWMWGYFMLGSTPKVDQLFPGMNVLDLFNPGIQSFPTMPAWSKIIPAVKLIRGDSFMFLGIGNILLLLLAIVIWFRLPVSNMDKAKKYSLIILIMALSIITLSNKIYIGEYEVINYPLFKPFEYFYTVFRGYGRLFWPVYYLIILFPIVIISKIPRRVSLAIIALFLAIHVYDLSGMLTSHRAFYSNPPTWESPLKSNLWNYFARHYDKVLYVLPGNNPFGFIPWVEYAAVHDLSINMGYFARDDANKVKAVRLKLTNELLAGNFDPKALYVVFEDEKLWKLAILKLRENDWAGVLDGIKIIAPEIQRNGFIDSPNGIASFNLSAPGRKHLIYGWSAPESWGTWSDGSESTIFFKFKKEPKGDIFLHLSGKAFVNEKHPSQRIDVVINDYNMGTIERKKSAEETHNILIPKQAFQTKTDELLINLKFRDAISPADINLSSDNRKLSFGLTKIWFSDSAGVARP